MPKNSEFSLNSIDNTKAIPDSQTEVVKENKIGIND